MTRLRYISYWHFLQAVSEFQPITLKEISLKLGVTTIESYKTINRLIARGLVKQQSKKVKRYILGVEAEKLLEKIYPANFLRLNPHTKRSKMRAKKRGKVFSEMI